MDSRESGSHIGIGGEYQAVHGRYGECSSRLHREQSSDLRNRDPGQFFLVLTGAFPVFGQKYQWTFNNNVLPSSQWNALTVFDLAVNSEGRAHLCFQGVEMQDHMTPGDVQHAVWDEGTSQFVSKDILPSNAPSTSLSGIAITIAKDDSVHIAFSDQMGLHYATQGANASNFQLADVDTQQGNILNPSIAVGSAGTIGISYIFQHTGVGAQLRYAQKTPAKWVLDTADPGPLPLNPPMAGLGVFPQHGTNSLVIDANEVPHIAYCDAGSPSRIRHGTWTAAGQGFWAISAFGFGEIVDQAGDSSTAKILLDKNNGLHIAYQASPQGPAGTTELRLATRTVSGWAPATADPSTNSGWAISAAMHPISGEPHIAYGCPNPSAPNGTFQLKHTWAIDLIRQPLPVPHKKRPILRLPT